MNAASDLAATIQPTSSRAVPKAGAAHGEAAAARKTAEEFAAFFFSQSFESIFSNMGSDAMFGGGSAEGVYKSLLTQEYGKIAARTGTGAAIADAVQREIIHLQEIA
jgi:peptidoglycan hydrolase FlgJ